MPQKIAYLASEYPGISHTFIFREIQTLRSSGLIVATASIRKPAHMDKMTDAEKADAQNTLYVKTTSFMGVVAAHLKTFRYSPLAYGKRLATAVKLARQGPRQIWKGVAYFVEAEVLLHWMQRQGIAHVHVHFANPASTVALIAASSGHVSFSLSVHGPDVFYNVERELLAEKFQRARFVRCISHYCRSQVMRLVPASHWPRFRIVRCGIDPGRFSPRPEPHNPIPRILCVGRLVPAKGQHILVEACYLLFEKKIPFHLTLVGDGPDRDHLVKRVAELGLSGCIRFTGAVGQDMVLDYYRSADIFVLASFAEGLPVVLMEAMSMEIPCVTTWITGVPELITHDIDGLLVAPGDPKGLATRLAHLLTKPAERVRLGRAGRKQVLEAYDLVRNCQKLIGLFTELKN